VTIFLLIGWGSYTYALAKLTAVQIRVFVKINSVSFKVANTFLEEHQFPGAFSMGLYTGISAESEGKFLIWRSIEGYVFLCGGILWVLAAFGIVGLELKNGYDVSIEGMELSVAVVVCVIEYLFFRRYLWVFKSYCVYSRTDKDTTGVSKSTDS